MLQHVSSEATLRPDSARDSRSLVAMGVADPINAIPLAAAMVRAKLALRGCGRLGPWPRLYGRCQTSGAAGIEIGERVRIVGSVVPVELTTHAGGRLCIGDRVFINYGTSVSAHSLVEIGSDCKIGQHAIVLDCDWHELEHPTHDGGHGQVGRVVLEDGVWLGARVTVLRGVTIGRASVVAAGSVVTEDIPAGVLAVGVPARVIRRLSFAS
jgi:acetyltransferase-like isoleucine patch superfamily enzyme